MPNDIHFFISSLPLLRFGQKPLLTHEEFLVSCRLNLPERDARLLAELTLEPQDRTWSLPAVQQWQQFEIFVRNATAQARAARLHVQAPAPHPTAMISQFTLKQVTDAFAKSNPAERETILDQARWNALEDLGAQHQFDLEALAVYTLKLLLLERIQSRQVTPGMDVFEKLVSQAVQQANETRTQA